MMYLSFSSDGQGKTRASGALGPMRMNGLARAAPWVMLATVLCACAHAGRCSKVEVEVIGDHVHSAKVSPDSVKRGEATSYLVRGDHEHAFSLKAEDMRQLELGKSVTVRTSSASAHVHDVTVRCQE